MNNTDWVILFKVLEYYGTLCRLDNRKVELTEELLEKVEHVMNGALMVFTPEERKIIAKSIHDHMEKSGWEYEANCAYRIERIVNEFNR